MSGHTIVCGLGQVGFRVVNLLLELGEEVYVITEEARAEWARDAGARGVKIAFGDARDQLLLQEAGLERARALIACTSSDVINIEIALDCKRIRPEMVVVVRLYDQALSKPMEENLGIDRAVAMSSIAAPAFAAAALGDHVTGEFAIGEDRYLIVQEHVGPDSPLAGSTPRAVSSRLGAATLFVIDAHGNLDLDPSPDRPFRDGDVVEVVGDVDSLGELGPYRPASTATGRVGRTLAVLGHALNPLHLLRFVERVWVHASMELKAVILAITLLTGISVFVFRFGLNLSFADAFYFVITTVTTTGYGDITPKEASLALKLYGCLLMVVGSAAVATLYSIVTDYIVTARLQQLVGRQRVPDAGHVIVAGIGDVGGRTVEELLKMGSRVVVIDHDSENHHFAGMRARVPIIIGDAREHETLSRAAVDKAISIIACSGDDAINLSVCLSASASNSAARKVLRVFDAGFASKIQVAAGIHVALSASRIAAPSFVSASLDGDSLAGFVSHGYLFSISPSKHVGRGVRTFYRTPAGGLTTDHEAGTTPAFSVLTRQMGKTEHGREGSRPNAF